MQHLCLGKRLKAIGFGCGGKLQFGPANFFCGTRINGSAERCSHDLRTKANTQRGPVKAQTARDDANLLAQPGVVCGLINANRAAQHDDQICRLPVKCVKVVQPGFKVGDIKSAPNQDLFEDAEIFKFQVAYGNALHTVAP
jgi:hypothetical protein